MTVRPGMHAWRRRALLACATVACAAVAASAHAEHADANPWLLALGPATGSIALDQDLANYRWDINPAMHWGAQATVYRGRFSAGARAWRAQTTQASGIPGETRAPHVNLTGLELTASARALRLAGIELWGSTHAGRLHLGYDPDRLSFDVAGLPDPVTVEYAPISEWTFGYGIELRREFMNRVAVALQGERTSFALDTAHRSGSAIVQSRERFTSWNLRMQISWLLRIG